MHESFYNSGSYINDQLGIYVGWICHKDSFSDCMPVVNENQDIVLIFSGENFPNNDTDSITQKQGNCFNPSNATSLIHLYEEDNDGFLSQLNGWFSGVLIDIRKKNIILFNDRYGLGRIYYHQNADGFYFSSEAKSLLKILPELRQLNFISLGEIFSCGCVLQNRTLFSNISLLPSGSKWIFNGTGDIRKDSYFSSDQYENQPLLSVDEYYEKLKETIVRIIPKYFFGERPVAMSLTGGIDGRIITACANRPVGSLPCYTFGSNYRDCADVKIARRIARICGQPHETISIDSDFFNNFGKLSEKAVYISDGGTMDVTGSVELYINKKS